MTLIVPTNALAQSINSNITDKQRDNIGTQRYLISLKNGKNQAVFLEKKGLKTRAKEDYSFTSTFGMELTQSEVENIRNDNDLSFMELDSTVNVASVGEIKRGQVDVGKGSGNSQSIPWGVDSIGADLAVQNKYDGKGVKIAVLDTGVSNHPDLKVAGCTSFVPGDTSYLDDNGHGTHVVGTITALDNKVGVVGVAPNSEIYAVKVLNGNGSGSYSQVIKGIDWAIKNKMNIISMSFGGPDYSQALKEAIKKANEQGILIIAAAGNGGLGNETELYPARYSEVISVGAGNKLLDRADFSSTGSELDLMAPGTDILSTLNDRSYGTLSGTSMAVPHVTGAAALIWSTNKKYTNEDIKSKLYASATSLGNAQQYGHGLVNVAKALGLVNGPIQPVVPEPVTGNPSPNTEFNIKVTGEKLLKLSSQLLSLKETAVRNSNLELAKEIENKYNELLGESVELNEVPLYLVARTLASEFWLYN